MSKERN